MGKNSISSANASFNLIIPDVSSSGVLLQGFAVNDMFDADAQILTASSVGVDGNSIADPVLHRGKMRVHFQANSPSIPIFYLWKSVQDGNILKLVQNPAVMATAKIICKSLGLDLDLDDITLTSIPPFPPHKRVAEELTVELEFAPNWHTAIDRT